MPRYFFDVQDGASIPDEDGTELTSLVEVRKAAVELAGSLLKDDAESFWKGDSWRIDVSDESRTLLFALHFHAVEAV